MLAFSFWAEEGNSVHVRVVDVDEKSPFEPRIWLYGPAGRVVAQSRDRMVAALDCHPVSSKCRLDATGMYRLVIADSNRVNPGKVRIEYLSVSNPGTSLVGFLGSGSADEGAYSGPSSEGAIDPALKNKIVDWHRNMVERNGDFPEYLYKTETFQNKVASGWMIATESVGGGESDKEIYDQFYGASVEYREQRNQSLIEAKKAIEAGDVASAQHFFDEAVRLDKLANISGAAAVDAFNGNLDSAYKAAESIYKLSKYSEKYIAAMGLGPLGSSVVDQVFVATDFYITKSRDGVPEAVRELVVSELVGAALNNVKLDELGGKTISDALAGGSSAAIDKSGLRELIGKALGSDEVRDVYFEFLKDSAGFAVNEGAEAALEEFTYFIGDLQQKYLESRH